MTVTAAAGGSGLSLDRRPGERGSRRDLYGGDYFESAVLVRQMIFDEVHAAGRDSVMSAVVDRRHALLAEVPHGEAQLLPRESADMFEIEQGESRVFVIGCALAVKQTQCRQPAVLFAPQAREKLARPQVETDHGFGIVALDVVLLAPSRVAEDAVRLRDSQKISASPVWSLSGWNRFINVRYTRSIVSPSDIGLRRRIS